ncbi:4-aminobutyrate--2-oxoglutarate transaminase [Thermus scotoductus]|uniref:4-aminobutyrate--2-oxoglutarate transaminase n=1 Tax=Thermus scotoductus TaxID=37636 RepID=A0A430SDH9_THESC|nr:4-aminobutyrate--2-oxoglutarate transaminase [Thermus scotoductus]RTG96578.1 4-aminobutyrate--2-oxoglutarate transaminase [Thermus scotoductus]RTH11283.1 4-aminobutyrate--2-oxoglutarate transaminase [Thermus scotoductus]RTH12772.1 4-aminobutyrate--2-oxoglutarate transaminase [Thermus scotoductus]RTH13801.1 4-aminobutyrate--2-oxoglutarate transaminase [Thermus scotoductus]RTH19639.1 4-aminobutyrate--2-oxoglutarate transaminase [Thermus scotoductus]
MALVDSRNQTLWQLRERYVPRGVAQAHPVFVARAEGSRIWDVDGKEYLDFAGGIGVMNVGHGHPRVLQAVRAQLERFTHACFQVTPYEAYVRLAERLAKLAPGDFSKKTLFLTTGAEAVENAVKIARAYTGRPAVVALTHSFHGRTLLGMSLTGKASYYKQNFGPFAPEVYHAPAPYPYRGVSDEMALEGLRELFRTAVDPERVAALVVEPVLGEGGFIPLSETYLREIREITASQGILLIADEIQSGFGRTGRMWAVEHSGVVPDLITFAKSVAAGLPLSGVVGRAEVMDAPKPGGLGGTYAGNPLACAAGLAVLDIFEEEGLLERARALGRVLWQALGRLKDRFPQVGEVRGLGPMVALELVRDPKTREPAPDLAQATLEEARRRGLILLKAGMYGNVIRVLVPLVATEAEVHEGLARLSAALEVALKEG